MFLTKVTITGIDDNVAYKDVIELTKEYPFIEWGILTSPTRIGGDRYPTFEWVNGLLKEFPQDMNIKRKFSLHTCGATSRYLTQKSFDQDIKVWNGFHNLLRTGFGRMQININISKITDINYSVFVNNVKKFSQYAGIIPIIQYNKSNGWLWFNLAKFGMFPNILFDQSGGRGQSPKVLFSPISGYFCGFAGGLNPANVEEYLVKLSSCWGSGIGWIDVESGVRTEDNKLDMNKVSMFLEKSKNSVLNVQNIC
jgi:hypothetical protein